MIKMRRKYTAKDESGNIIGEYPTRNLAKEREREYKGIRQIKEAREAMKKKKTRKTKKRKRTNRG